MNEYFFLWFILLIFLSCGTEAQQNYSGNSALDCGATDETGPSPAFLYTCNGQQRSCKAFLVFKSQSFYNSVPTISALFSADQEELATINNVTRLSVFPIDQEVIVPVNCSCLGNYYEANTTFHVTNEQGTYYVIAMKAYEGLSTCASLARANPFGQYHLPLDALLRVPLRCACPTSNQTMSGIKFLLTYSVSWDDLDVAVIAQRFNVSRKSVLDANGLGDDPKLEQDTTILIPLSVRPLSSQTIIHRKPPETSASSSTEVSDNEHGGGSKRKVYVYAGVAASCSLLFLGTSLALVFALRRMEKQKALRAGSKKKEVMQKDLRVEIASFEQVLKVYGIEEVTKATKNFNNERRIKGSVYWGEFGEETLAVKKMKGDVSEEVKILRRINHSNLIQLVGVSENYGCFYLVFEYMKNGSLRGWLSSNRFEGGGSLAKRMEIAMDVASGLHYLHSFIKPAYVHQNINSSNILLNGEMRAKIANFSLAREAAREATDVVLTNHITGTRGYMAPEYVQTGQLNPKIDVYAFGVVLLELITGKDAVFTLNGREVLLSATVLAIMQSENAEAKLELLVDPSLRGSHGLKELALRLARVSIACLTQEPARRPSMEDVVSHLLKLQADLYKSESFEVVSGEEAVLL